ncbi:MAG: class I SAM-dependent methyltransferase [Solirubrobacteraceae bacterium]
MGIGTAVRHRLGPLEGVASELYRSRFIDLDELTRTLTSLTQAQRIVEIGCGEGAVAERLLRKLPTARYVGVDVAPEPGRMFAGDRRRAEFARMSSAEFLAEAPEPFDLALLVDVFHHLPEGLRIATLRDLGRLCRPGGLIAIKDWERSATPWHLACYSADRYVTGDAGVRYPTRPELLDAIALAIPGAELVCEARIPPRRNNLLLALRQTT